MFYVPAFRLFILTFSWNLVGGLVTKIDQMCVWASFFFFIQHMLAELGPFLSPIKKGCGRNSTYSFKPILLKLSLWAHYDLKVCILFRFYISIIFGPFSKYLRGFNGFFNYLCYSGGIVFHKHNSSFEINSRLMVCICYL